MIEKDIKTRNFIIKHLNWPPGDISIENKHSIVKWFALPCPGCQKNYKAFKLNKSMVNSLGKKKVEANFGDTFMQSFLILHQSGFNSSNKIRFTLIGRYLNIGNKNFKGCKKSMEPLSLY